MSKLTDNFTPESFTGPNLWAYVKGLLGKSSCSLEELIDALEYGGGVTEGLLDGAIELIQDEGPVVTDDDLNFSEVEGAA